MARTSRTLLPALALGLLGLLSSCAGAPTPVRTPAQAQTPPPAGPAVAGLDSVAFVRAMGLGWNLGNTLEACGNWIKGDTVSAYETAWGNPVTTKAMIDAVRDSGFKSVRIPVAWSNLMGKDYTINPALLDRVQQVVDWVLADGMVAVVNDHWDGGWWSKFPTQPADCMHHYRRIWQQVSARFKDYPDGLVFESANEELSFNDLWNRWGGPAPAKKAQAYALANRINQTFVDLVRKSGGKNATRQLLIAGYATDIALTTDPLFHLPKDPAGREIVSVHYYTPFPFAGLVKDAKWAKARRTWGTKADYAELDANMAKLKTRFLDHGVPVIVGEYGSEVKNKDPKSVRRYLLAVAGKIYGMGMCPMLWAPGSHFNRRTLTWNDPGLPAGYRKIEASQRGR